MADLDVKPKKRSSAWVWILLLLLIAVAVYFFTRNREGMNDPINGTNTSDSSVVTDTSAP